MRASRAALAAAVVVLGCVPPPEDAPVEAPVQPRPPAAAPSPPPAGWYQVGRASFYSDRLAGHRTASGEPYDPSALTAAHPTLPLGAVVDVVRVDGRSVRVRVNDRGPHARGRIVDLSGRAAAELGMLREGVVDVAIRVVRLP